MTTAPTNLPSAEDLDRVAEDQQAAAATGLPPAPEDIDAEIVFYQQAMACLKQAKETADKYRDRLVELAKAHGFQPPHAEQSLRLNGRRNTVTVTTGTTVTVNESAVMELSEYLGRNGVAGVFNRLFAVQTKYSLVEGARDVLKTFELPRRVHEKVLSLFGRCIDLKAKAPTVKIEVIQPEKPARKPRRKAVA